MVSTFKGWPAPARTLVERAVERHGGWNRFERLTSIELRLDVLGGPLPRFKGLGRTFSAPQRVRVEPHALRTVFLDHPSAGVDGHFEAGGVLQLERDSGGILAESRDHRRTFAGWAKYRRWSDLDALYFFGYALCTYFSVPFVLPRMEYAGQQTARISGQDWTGVTVIFPESFSTHSRRQTFYFDDTGLLRRHDYVADVVGSWARGAHFSDEYAEVQGLQFARRRHVQAMLFGRVTPVPVLDARLGEFLTT